MSTGILTIVLFGSLIILVMTGLPLVFVMGGLAALFICILINPAALSLISSNAIGVMNNFVLIAIPLFVFMGMVLERSGVAEDAYEMFYKWMGGLKGGLAMATIVVCAIFAACVGITAAATVAMGVIALPAMLKRGYNKSIAIGSISAGGTLGILIPPSILFIVFGVMTGESIGKLFAAGIIPGILLAVMFFIYIGVRCYLQPNMGPAIPLEERASFKEKISSLRMLILPLLLIAAVLGTMFAGICTPTEAAGIGALGSLICAAVRGRLNWKLIKDSSYETLRLSCMICWLIIAGTCFSVLYNALGAQAFLKEVLSTMPVSPYVTIVGIVVILIILGCLLDPGSIIMITTPIFVPVIVALGFDPIWFGVLFIINMEMGYLTPPFGFNLFYMKSIVPKSITMGDIYRSIFPFLLVMVACMAIIIAFPEIALWLPNQLFK